MISKYQWFLLVDASHANDGNAYHPQQRVVNDLFYLGYAESIGYVVGRGYGVHITDAGRKLIQPNKGPERRVVQLAPDVSDALVIMERIQQTGNVVATLAACREAWGDARYIRAFDKWSMMS